MIENKILNLNIDQTYFKTLSEEQQLELLIETFKSNKAQFKKIDENLCVDELAFFLMDQFEKKQSIKELERLDAAMRNQVQFYKSQAQYVSQTLIPLYLAEDRANSEEENERLELYLKPFYENPADSADIFLDVLEKLLCYDKRMLAVDLCKKNYKKMAGSRKLFGNAEAILAHVIVWNELQIAYSTIKKNIEFDWVSFNKMTKPYDYHFSQDHLKEFEEAMMDKWDPDKRAKTFKTEVNLTLMKIKIDFCCYMYDLDGTSFVTSEYFASTLIDYLFSIPGREKCPLNVFFKIKYDHLLSYLLKDKGWFDDTHKSFAILAGSSNFYLTLLKKGILDQKDVDSCLVALMRATSELKKVHSDYSWKYNFIESVGVKPR
jgi:hypothetical protein